MKVKDLIDKLIMLDEELEIYIGVEGYSTNEIGIYPNDNYVFICDGCYYEEVDE